MTQIQADEICKTALPFDIYKKISETELIGTANSIMFYCACMIKKTTDFDCDLKFEIVFKNSLFKKIKK